MGAEQIFLGLDSGTQSTKGLALDRDTGEVLAEAHALHDIIENSQGRREQDPAWWVDATDQVIGSLCRQLGPRRSRVRGIGVSGQQHGFVPLDKKGEVIRPAKLWCDTETAAQCDTITERAGGLETVIGRIGNAVAAGFTASKILWLMENEPANYERLSTVLLPHDYLNFVLTGRRVAECGDASGTALFDVANRTWSQELIRAVDPSGKLVSCLPELIESHEPVGRILPEMAERWGLPGDVLVSSGGGDNMMAAIGTGNVAPGVVTASLGTSGTIYAHSETPVIDPRGELAAFCSSTGAWLPLVCTMNVTVSTELVRELLDIDVASLNKAATSAPPGSDGVLLVPYFNGERTPALPLGKACFYGLTSANFTRANLCRAAMEGATLGLRYGLDVLRRLGVAPAEIRLVGGGAKSALWRSMVADVFRCPVVTPVQPEAGALGGALQAMWCFLLNQGGDVELKDITAKHVSLDPAGAASPSPDNAAFYDDLYARYQDLDHALRPLAAS